MIPFFEFWSKTSQNDTFFTLEILSFFILHKANWLGGRLAPFSRTECRWVFRLVPWQVLNPAWLWNIAAWLWNATIHTTATLGLPSKYHILTRKTCTSYAFLTYNIIANIHSEARRSLLKVLLHHFLLQEWRKLWEVCTSEEFSWRKNLSKTPGLSIFRLGCVVSRFSCSLDPFAWPGVPGTAIWHNAWSVQGVPPFLVVDLSFIQKNVVPNSVSFLVLIFLLISRHSLICGFVNKTAKCNKKTGTSLITKLLMEKILQPLGCPKLLGLYPKRCRIFPSIVSLQHFLTKNRFYGFALQVTWYSMLATVAREMQWSGPRFL